MIAPLLAFVQLFAAADPAQCLRDLQQEVREQLFDLRVPAGSLTFQPWAQAKSDPSAVDLGLVMRCETWQKHHRFDDLRSCYLSVVRVGASKADVVAMLGPGERVTVSHNDWNPPREAYSYTPADRTDLNYVAVYKDGIVVEQCSYSLDESTGEASVVLP